MALWQSFPLTSPGQINGSIYQVLLEMLSSSGCYDAASLSPLRIFSISPMGRYAKVRRCTCVNKELTPNSGCSGTSSFGEQSYFVMRSANHLLYETVLRKQSRSNNTSRRHCATYNGLYRLTSCVFMSSLDMSQGLKAKGREHGQESIYSWKACKIIKIQLLFCSTARTVIPVYRCGW